MKIKQLVTVIFISGLLVSCTITETTESGKRKWEIEPTGHGIQILPVKPSTTEPISNQDTSLLSGNYYRELTPEEKASLLAKFPQQDCQSFSYNQTNIVVYIEPGKEQFVKDVYLPACTIARFKLSASFSGISVQQKLFVSAFENGGTPAAIAIIKGDSIYQDKLAQTIFILPDKQEYNVQFVSRKSGTYRIYFRY